MEIGPGGRTYRMVLGPRLGLAALATGHLAVTPEADAAPATRLVLPVAVTAERTRVIEVEA